MIKFVTTYHGMHLNVFLVVDQDQAYLLCYEHETDEFGYMCPCCMNDSHRRAIMDTVSEAIRDGNVKGTVLWCSHKKDSPHLGENLGHYAPLEQRMFKGGSAKGISAETKALIREEALRQVAVGAIKDFAPRT